MPDREKVIEGLETCLQCREPKDCAECTYNDMRTYSVPCGHVLMADALALLNEQRWIPATFLLPTAAGEYLVAYHPCHWDDVKTSVIKVGVDNFRGRTTWAQKKYQRVIAWMPLPEPPKEEDDDEVH